MPVGDHDASMQNRPALMIRVENDGTHILSSVRPQIGKLAICGWALSTLSAMLDSPLADV